MINGIVYLVQAPFGIGYILYAAVQQLIVITGLHHSLSIIELGLLNTSGENVLQVLGTASMAGQFGAAIAAAFLYRNKVKRLNAISAAVPTFVWDHGTIIVWDQSSVLAYFCFWHGWGGPSAA